MNRKTLILAIVALGLVVAATSAAFSLYPPNWFARDSASAAPATPAAAPSVPR